MADSYGQKNENEKWGNDFDGLVFHDDPYPPNKKELKSEYGSAGLKCRGYALTRFWGLLEGLFRLFEVDI